MSKLQYFTSCLNHFRQSFFVLDFKKAVDESWHVVEAADSFAITEKEFVIFSAHR